MEFEVSLLYPSIVTTGPSAIPSRGANHANIHRFGLVEGAGRKFGVAALPAKEDSGQIARWFVHHDLARLREIVPSLMPARLADGLGLRSGPCERLPAPFAPS